MGIDVDDVTLFAIRYCCYVCAESSRDECIFWIWLFGFDFVGDVLLNVAVDIIVFDIVDKERLLE